MPLASNYANGTFYNGHWFCGCGVEAPWRTSKQESSKDEKFASCTARQCRFFLTAEDDAAARVKKSSDTPPAPHTPTGKQNSGMPQTLPTPDTGKSFGTRLFTAESSRGGFLQKHDGTPTPHRFRAVENMDLSSLVIGLLQKDGVVLRSSTESAIRHVIGERIAVNEAQIQNLEESLGMASKKLDELEKEGRSAT